MRRHLVTAGLVAGLALALAGTVTWGIYAGLTDAFTPLAVLGLLLAGFSPRSHR